MKVFVTGVGGQLGYDVMKELEKRGYESYGSDLQENSIFSNYIKLDLTDENEVTLKTFYKENGYFRLQPENDTMEP